MTDAERAGSTNPQNPPAAPPTPEQEVTETNDTTPLATHALNYANHGLEIFPVNPQTKAPLTSQYNATTNPDTIQKWWNRWSGALIGHRLAADVVITDIDPRHHGDNTWAALLDEMDSPPPLTRTHLSGRGDGGSHLWWQHPGVNLNIGGLNNWAHRAGTGHAIETTGPNGTTQTTDRWTAGIDLLHRDHRYTILPPSPHPDTGQPYHWHESADLALAPLPMPALLVELLYEPAHPPEPPDPVQHQADSIADKFSANTRWATLLEPHGWTLIHGDGQTDGSAWRHPTATAATSATIKHGCLFVWSPNTPFEPSAPGDPHGYTPFHAYAVLAHRGDQSAAAKTIRANHNERIDVHALIGTPQPPATPKPHLTLLESEPSHPEPLPPGPELIDWPTFWAEEHRGEDWLVHPLLPRGRQVALWARHKTGKSLIALEIAAALATGRGCLSQPADNPIDVIYLDMEMTEDDLHERLTDLDYGPDDNLDRLHYGLLPSLPPLDTPQGGAVLAEMVDHYNAQLVIIDTMARVVVGDENEADTYRDYYRYTGMALKRIGVSVLRLDHGGKDATKGQRGSSSKGDDVDVVWQLRPAQDGLELERDLSRMSWVPATVALRRLEDPLRHSVISGGLWPAGTAETAAVMRQLGITSATTQTDALKIYREAGYKGSRSVLRAAHRYLRELEERDL